MADPTDKDIKQAEQELEALAARLNEFRNVGEDISEFYKRILNHSQNISLEQRKYLEDKNREIQLLKDAAEARRESIQELEEEIKYTKDEIEKRQKILELMRLKLIEAKKSGNLTPQELKSLEDEYQKEKDILKNLREQEKSKEKIKEIGDAITGGLFSQIKNYFTVEGQLKNISDIFTSIMEGNTEYARTTGQIADRTFTFGMGAASFGVGFEKMNKAAMSLYTSMSGFSELNKEVQENLALSTAKLENLGVSAEASGKNMDILMKTFKMSSQEAINTNEELAKIAIGAGIAPSKMVQGFAEQMPRLAAYGKQAIQVYADLQKQAKSLGMEISTLTSIVGDQMDTFEGAARAAGKFNAVMGGNYLNSMELLNATESERVVILKKSFEQSGRNFDSLSKYEKKAIAATLGISDLNEATKLFSKSSAELEMDQAQQAATQERLEAAQKEAAKTTDQIKEAFNSLMIVIRPVVGLVKGVINLLSSFADIGGGVGGVILNIGVAVFLLGGKLKGVGSAISGFVTKIFGLGTASATTATEMSVSAPVISTSSAEMGAAAGASAIEILALGVALLAIGAGIYLAATGIGNLVKSFSGLNSEQIAAASVALIGFGASVGILVYSLLTLTPVSVIAIETLLGLGAAIAIISIGLTTILLGFRTFFESLSIVSGDSGSQIANNILLIADSMTALMSAVAFGSFMGLGALGLLSLVGSVYMLADAMKEIPENKTVTLQTLDETLKTVKSMKTTDLDPAKEFMTVAKEFYVVQKESKDADKDALVTALKEIVKTTNPFTAAGEGGGANQIPINLVLTDGQQFAAKMRILGRERFLDTQGTRNYAPNKGVR